MKTANAIQLGMACFIFGFGLPIRDASTEDLALVFIVSVGIGIVTGAMGFLPGLFFQFFSGRLNPNAFSFGILALSATSFLKVVDPANGVSILPSLIFIAWLKKGSTADQ